MKILLIEPGEAPRSAEIASTLEAMQAAVGGPIPGYPFEEPVALICHQEGKLLGLPLNRVLRDENGQVYDVVAGTFFLCAAPPESERFESLSDGQLARYQAPFNCHELFAGGVST